MECLDDVKAWMATNFLSFNANKTEAMIFGGTTGTRSVELGAMAQYTKPVKTNLGVKIDASLSSTVRLEQ